MQSPLKKKSFAAEELARRRKKKPSPTQLPLETPQETIARLESELAQAKENDLCQN